MGLLTDLIYKNSQKKAAQEASQVDFYKLMLSLPNNTPQTIAAKTQALQGILKLSKMKGPERDSFEKLLSVAAYSPQDSGPRYPGQPEKQPQGLFLTPQQEEAQVRRAAQQKEDIAYQEAIDKGNAEAQTAQMKKRLDFEEQQREIDQISKDPNLDEDEKQRRMVDAKLREPFEIGYVQPPLGKARTVFIEKETGNVYRVGQDGKKVKFTPPEGWTWGVGKPEKPSETDEARKAAEDLYREQHNISEDKPLTASQQADAKREYAERTTKPKETEYSEYVRGRKGFYKSQGMSDDDALNLALKDEKDKEDIDEQKKKADLRKVQESESMPTVEPGTAEYNVADMLGTGKLTMQRFRSLYAFSRDTNKRVAIFNTAHELHPEFDPAAYELGFKLAGTPRVQQQAASLKNVSSGVKDLLKASDAAVRTGSPLLNKVVIPAAGIVIGNKKYSNWNTARVAFADELSGALGYGSATDMTREMGFNMTDVNLSPEAFRSAIQDIVIPFVDRKKASLLQGMGVYGQPGMSPAAGSPAASSGLRIQVGDKLYDYKGSGPTEDLSNYTEVK